jgi:hypothetical protein
MGAFGIDPRPYDLNVLDLSSDNVIQYPLRCALPHMAVPSVPFVVIYFLIDRYRKVDTTDSQPYRLVIYYVV